MTNKPVYQVSARQLILLAFATAIIAVGATTLLYTLGNYWNNSGSASPLAESASVPAGISDPAQVSDEQNSIEVYKSIAPGVAFINTTSYSQSMWGDVQEGK